jgi:tape measure domain-containing protein
MATKNIDVIITAKDRATPAIKDVSSAMGQMSNQADATGTSVIGMSKKTAVLGGLMAGAAATGVLALTSALKEGASAAITGATAYEQYAVAFETMLGSAEASQTLLIQMSAFARKTPFELPEVVLGAKQLAAYGIESEKLIPTLKVMGDIASGVGREKLPDLIRAFGQVRAKGKLMAQELNQFAEAGVPLREMLAKELKMSLEDFSTALDKGQLDIKFAQVEKALNSLTGEGGRFFNLMEKQSTTVSGKWSKPQGQHLCCRSRHRRYRGLRGSP